MQVMLKGGEKVYEAFLDRNALVELAAWCHEEPGVGLICFEEMTPLLLEGTLEELNECFPRYAQEALIAQHVPAGPTIKANVYITGSLERTHAIVDRLNRELPALTFDVPQPLWSNVTPHGWTKASGIDLLCELLGIGLDQVVVFGDGGNDVAMLQHVPCSVAVEGAAPEATQAARCILDAASMMQYRLLSKHSLRASFRLHPKLLVQALIDCSSDRLGVGCILHLGTELGCVRTRAMVERSSRCVPAPSSEETSRASA
jgi:hydroxymethylpyrimidine pyrophosphatase-like HAD family hydrolase